MRCLSLAMKRSIEVLLCGKRTGTEKLIKAPGVYICDECIELCNEIIEGGTLANRPVLS